MLRHFRQTVKYEGEQCLWIQKFCYKCLLNCCSLEMKIKMKISRFQVSLQWLTHVIPSVCHTHAEVSILSVCHTHAWICTPLVCNTHTGISMVLVCHTHAAFIMPLVYRPGQDKGYSIVDNSVSLGTVASPTDQCGRVNSSTVRLLKLLEVTLDPAFIVDEQTKNVYKTLFFHINAPRHVRPPITKEIANCVACSFV